MEKRNDKHLKVESGEANRAAEAFEIEDKVGEKDGERENTFLSEGEKMEKRAKKHKRKHKLKMESVET